MCSSRFRFVPLLAVSAACGGASGPEPAAAPPPAAEPAATAPAAAAQPAPPPAKAEPAPPPADPARAAALLDQGRALQAEKGEGGAAEAVALYEQAVAADPKCAACYWEMGWSRQVLSDWTGCLAAWDHVRAIDPAYPELDVHYPVAVLRQREAAALAALPEAHDLPPPEIEPFAGPTFTLRAVGDIQLGMGWPPGREVLPPDDARDMLMYLQDDLRAADVTFGNLETALADEGDSTKCGPKSTKCFAFRVPTRYAAALKDAGFDVLSIANNHAGDFGEPGRLSTMKALDGVSILHSGPIGDIASWQTKGLSIGLIGFSTGGGVYKLQDLEMARRVVAEVDRTHDIVIVSYHGGAEGTAAAHVPHGTEMFLGEDRGDLRAFTHAVVDAGADLVIGHGPHLMRGIEIYQGRLIAYSMGNFCTWETFNLTGPLGLTGILEVELAANGVALGAKLLPGVIEKPGRPKPDPKKRVLDHVRKLSKEDFGDALLSPQGVWKRAAPTAMAGEAP